MTETEAKTKWCPMVRFVPSTNDHHSYDNRAAAQAQGIAPSPTCLGSACMAWRAIAPSVERGPVVERHRAEPGSRRPAGEDWGYEAADPNSAAAGGDWVRFGLITTTPHGYCGLAGAPQ